MADIGIPAAVLDEIRPATFENGPGLWRIPAIDPMGHKYRRGHVLVLGGAEMTGAARLAAAAARRAGAGLVTMAAPDAARSVYQLAEPGLLVRNADPFGPLIADPRYNVAVLGPGAGRGEDTLAKVSDWLALGRAAVLDADAIDPGVLGALSAQVVLTPHDGEFARLFPGLAGNRLGRAREGARRSGAVMLLKGPDTVVAHPDGRAAILTHAPPWLATAGSGDVLAGIIAGLMARGMAAFDAAQAGAWLHGEAANAAGPALIAEDLPLYLKGIGIEGR